ncbi:retrovirus-related pol polyprotein from transposon TNT 1-94 [Tanacetum coccineum]
MVWALRVVDSHTDNHLEDNFTPLEGFKVQLGEDLIQAQRGCLRAGEGGQAPETIMSFIKRVENQNDIKVKQLRTDNGTKFKNNILVNFCDEKGIYQNFSSPYTPEQNGVIERKNRTLIEAVRTMLSGSVFSKQYWTEVVAIACYTQNRSTIVKRHLKTPYEIFHKRIPNIEFLYVFGCPVYIHTHKDHLGKFDEKDDDGYFLEYSHVSKAFKVFNTRRQQTEETNHITFDESPDAIKFTKPLADNINIAESERYPPDEYLYPYEPSYRIRRWGERTVGFKGTQSRGESRVEKNTEGGRPLEEAPKRNGGQSALPNNIGGNLPSNGAVLNPAGSVTPFVRLIEDYPLPDGLKIPSHIGSYNGKGDPDNFLHLFEGAIRMQKWLMLVACHMFTYTLKDSARIWWNSQKAVVHNIKQREGESTRAFITRYIDDTLQILGLHEEQRISSFVHGLRTRSLVEHLSTDLPSTYKGLMEKTYTWVEAREKNKDKFSPYRGPNHGLLPSLSKSPKEILATEKAERSFEPPPKMFGSKQSRDMSKYCHFHEDYGHDTNDCRHLRTQIQEAVNLGQLSHLVKGIKKERTKSSDTPRGESKKDKGTAPTEAPTLMVSREAHIVKSLAQENTDYRGKELIFPSVTKVNNAPVIIEAKIFGRKVRRVYMDSGSSCEIIHEQCFEKLNPTIKATKVDLKTPLVGFSRERSWSIGEVPLEIK